MKYGIIALLLFTISCTNETIKVGNCYYNTFTGNFIKITKEEKYGYYISVYNNSNQKYEDQNYLLKRYCDGYVNADCFP